MSDRIAATSIIRQQWLENAVKELRLWFSERGYDVPNNVRISIGWPRGAHGRGRAIGQCWFAEGSDDDYNEIFISPELGQLKKKDQPDPSVQIIGVIVHELCHAVAGREAGHKRPFREVAEAVGLEGKMTATTEGEELIGFADQFIAQHGAYPAGRLNPKQVKKQSTRMMKCECEECGCIARLTRKWLEASGAPYCGIKSHGRMKSDWEGEEDEG